MGGDHDDVTDPGILVDDGIATGATIRAAVLALRQQRPARLVIAAPTASTEACSMLAALADELVVLITPPCFRAVAQWYLEFSQTTDAEVTRLLALANSRAEAHPTKLDEGPARPRDAG